MNNQDFRNVVVDALSGIDGLSIVEYDVDLELDKILQKTCSKDIGFQIFAIDIPRISTEHAPGGGRKRQNNVYFSCRFISQAICQTDLSVTYSLNDEIMTALIRGINACKNPLMNSTIYLAGDGSIVSILDKGFEEGGAYFSVFKYNFELVNWEDL